MPELPAGRRGELRRGGQGARMTAGSIVYGLRLYVEPLASGTATHAAARERASRRDEAAENIAVTLEVGRAVLEGDLDALVALVSEHFEGHPHARPDYVFRGPGGVREYWQGNVECNRQIRAGTR